MDEADLSHGEAPRAIRPRTKSERMAFIAGYVMALEMVEDGGGVNAAREWLRTTAELEEELTE